MNKLRGGLVLALVLVGSLTEAAQLPQAISLVRRHKPITTQADFIGRTTKYNQAQWGASTKTSLRSKPVYLHPYPAGRIGF